MNREAYEELYREAWLKQNEIDRAVNKKLAANPLHRDPEKAKKSGQAGGFKGGRPAGKLTENAKTINRMLKEGMTVALIARILDRDARSILNTKQRYKLPREDVS